MCCSLLVVRCLLHVVYRSCVLCWGVLRVVLIVVRCGLFGVVRCVSFFVCRSLCVVRCVLFVVCCVVCCLLFVV